MSRNQQYHYYVCISVGVAATTALVWRFARSDSDKSSNNDSNDATTPTVMPLHLERELYKQQRRQELAPKLAMKKKMYDNIYMYSPDNVLLSTISLKKAKWYVKKNLADWKQHNNDNNTQTDSNATKSAVTATTNPTAIILKFVPNSNKTWKYNKTSIEYTQSPQNQLQAYNATTKLNICVVCGSDQNYMRHYIIPYAYRSLLPKRYKTHMPHDVVLVCAANCQVKVGQACSARKKQLEERARRDYERRLLSENKDLDKVNTSHYYLTNYTIHSVKSAATALSRQRAKLPDDRINEYEQLIRRHYNIDSDNADTMAALIERACQLDERTVNPHYISGAELVIDTLENDNDRIADFIVSWRQYFVDEHAPKYLPHGWSVDAPVTCDTR